MRILLFLLAIVAGSFGYLMMENSKSAIHEIEALLLFLICAVLLSGAGIIDAILAVKREIKKQNNIQPETLDNDK